MRRLVVVGLCGFLLACAGLGESILEGVTGEEVDIREDGMDMTVDGGRVSLDWGPGVAHDQGRVPLSPPAGGELLVSGEVVFPDAAPAYIVIYGAVPGEMGAVAEQYRQEMAGRGLSVVKNTSEPGSISIEGQQGEQFYVATVSPESPSGALSVMLGAGPKEAIEKGMEAAPD